MSNYIFTRNERFYVQAQPLFNVIPGGNITTPAPASLTGSNALRGIKNTMMSDVALLTRRDKTGTRTAALGTQGRGMGKWTMEASLVSSGALGILPSLDPVFAALFGQVGTATAGTNVVYNLNDTLLYFALWSFRSTSAGAAADARVAFGCVPTEATFNLGQDIAEFTITGENKWMLRSLGFASMNGDKQGGLSIFPTEPARPVYVDGGLIAGFTGSATLGGNILTNNIVSASISVKTGAVVVKNQFGAYTPQIGEADERNISVTFGLYDDEGPAIETLKEASELKTPINLTFVIGAVPGSIFTFLLTNVQLGSSEIDDNSQRRAIVNFQASRAFGTNVTSHNEMTMTIT